MKARTKTINENTETLRKGSIAIMHPNARNKAFWRELLSTEPTDVVDLDLEAQDKFADLFNDTYNPNHDENKDMSVDLFLSGTIPVKDMKFVGEFTQKEENRHNYTKAEWTRVRLYENFHQLLQTESRNAVTVGQIIIGYPGHLLGVDIVVKLKESQVAIGHFIYYKRLGEKSASWCKEELDQYANYLLQFYLGIQLALLHPVTKEIYLKPPVMVEEINEEEMKRHPKREYKTPPLRYVKKIIIRGEDIDENGTVVIGKKTFSRRKLIWRVAGHWRDQPTKTGIRRIWIDGYFKGPLRDAKKLEQARQREIVTQEEETEA